MNWKRNNSKPSEGSIYDIWFGLLSNLRSFVQPSEGFDSRKTKTSKFNFHLQTIPIMILFLIFFSCESTTKSDTTYEEFHPGIYKYSGYNENDDLFVSGKLRFHFGEDSSLVGSWEMDAVAAGKTDHPHFGQGDLGGGIDNDTLWCNLHPGWMDHNIILRGYYENGEITGEWSYISFIGYTSGGKFKATYFSAKE